MQVQVQVQVQVLVQMQVLGWLPAVLFEDDGGDDGGDHEANAAAGPDEVDGVYTGAHRLGQVGLGRAEDTCSRRVQRRPGSATRDQYVVFAHCTGVGWMFTMLSGMVQSLVFSFQLCVVIFLNAGSSKEAEVITMHGHRGARLSSVEYGFHGFNDPWIQQN